tara:strand:+ start:4428 stop:5063 length:636 start_codon:yes stop_codon:yes gene_type:complete
MATKNSAKSVWATLSAIDVSDHIEKKGQFSYVSWAWAWALVKQHYPTATFEKHTFNDNQNNILPFMRDSLTFTYVSVSVTIEGITQSEIYPVLGNRNEPLKAATSFQVNTALQRGLVKCLAYHGLGTSIYAGEDLPVMDKDYLDIKKATKSEQDHAHYQRIDSALGACKDKDELIATWKSEAPVIAKLDNKVVSKLQGHYKTYLNKLKAAA